MRLGKSEEKWTIAEELCSFYEGQVTAAKAGERFPCVSLGPAVQLISLFGICTCSLHVCWLCGPSTSSLIRLVEFPLTSVLQRRVSETICSLTMLSYCHLLSSK